MLKICSVNRNENEKQLELFNKAFGTNFTKEKWDIKHNNNPYKGSSENICMYDENVLVGFNLFMPQKYVIDNKEIVFLQSCESVVDQHYQGHGYLREILSKAEEILRSRYPVIFGIPNNKSKPTFKKLGYKEKLILERMKKVGSLQNIIIDIVSRRKKDVEYNFERKSNEVYISDDFVELIANIRIPIGVIQIKKDLELFKWKIDSNPYRQMRYFYTKDENGIKAYCIVHFSPKSKIRKAEIIDYYIRDDYIKDFKLIIKDIQKRVSVISILLSNARDVKQIFIKCGFKSKSDGNASLMYKVISNDDKLEHIIDEYIWDFRIIEADTVFN